MSVESPQTEKEINDFNRANQVNTNDRNIWSIEPKKSLEQLVEYHKKSAELIILRNWTESGKRPLKKNMTGSSRALWKFWTGFRNLQTEN